jgi:hypothetical protein
MGYDYNCDGQSIHQAVNTAFVKALISTSLSHNLRKNFFLSVNYLTLPTDFLNDAP